MDTQKTLTGRAEVLEGLAEEPAIKALVAWKPEVIVDATFDRGELTLTVAPENICTAAETVRKAGYNFLEDLTAVDWFPASPRYQVTYHILSHSLKKYLRLVTRIDGDTPAIDSMTAVWPSANYYEREVFDLFGIRFVGHPNLRRILLPDEWEGYPLRKDYPVEGYR